MKNKFGILVALLCASVAFAGPYDTWSNWRYVTVNTTTAGVASTITNFPLVVQLTNASAATGSDVLAASSTGSDVRFTDSAGATALSYEIDTWTSTSAAVWVNVPSIAGSATTTIRMYWGKVGQTDASNAGAVWDTANGYKAVYHLGNASGTNSRPNSVTPYAALAATPRASINNASGIIGLSDTIDTPVAANYTGGTGEWFQLDSGTATDAFNFPARTLHGATGRVTVSYWMRLSPSNAANKKIWLLGGIYQPTASGTVVTNPPDHVCNFFNGTSFYFRYYTTAVQNNTATAQTIVTTPGDNTWHHIAMVYAENAGATTDSNLKYIDGVQVGTTLTATSLMTSNPRLYDAIGRTLENSTDKGPIGSLDEFEISNARRTPDEIKLSYATQVPGQTTVALGTTNSNAPTVPGAPTAVVGTAGNASASVSWTAPASNGGATITTYTVSSTPTSAGCTTTGGIGCTVTGLTNGTAYTFTVTATNSAGTSAASVASASVTPQAVVGAPSAPTGASAIAGNARATVSWTASSTGSPTSYTVTSAPDGKTCTTAGLTCVDSTLTNGTAYTFTVTATNSSGTSAPSTASTSVTPVGAPAAPTAVTGMSGNGQVVVSWTAGSNGGSAIIVSTVTAAPGGATCSSTSAATCTVTGLTNGTAYTFTVTATNALGTSSASTASSAVTPATVPGAPTGVTGVGASGQVTVSWVAPTSTGGSAITGYTVTASDTSKHCTTTGALTCAVTGLTNTTAYTFTVVATNAVGKSAASTASASVTSLFSFTKDLNLRMTASSMSLRLPEISGTAQVSVMDLWGRVVWSQTVGSGTREVSWARSSSSGIVPGLYILRLSLQDANHKSHLAAESKIMLTP